MRRCKRIRRAERRKNSAPPPPAGARRFRRDLSVARAQEFPEGRGRRIAKFSFGKNEVKLGELPSFGISRKGRLETFARDLQSFRSFAAEKRGTLGKTAKTFQCGGGRLKAGRAPPCAQCVFCVRAHRLREAIGRQVRPRRICRYWRLCFRRRRRRMARYCRPFKPRLPLRSEYFPKPGKRCAGSRLSRIVRRRWGSHFFRARGSPPDFPAAARRSGKCVAGVFGACGGGVPVARFPFSG